MIRNASMLKMATFDLLDEQLSKEMQDQIDVIYFGHVVTMPDGRKELKVQETQRRLRALPLPLRRRLERGGEMLPQRVTADDLVLTQPCRDCAGLGLTESVESVYSFCRPCNGTGRILKRKSKRESIVARMATILLTLTLLGIGVWWALVRWGVL